MSGLKLSQDSISGLDQICTLQPFEVLKIVEPKKPVTPIEDNKNNKKKPYRRRWFLPSWFYKFWKK